MYKEELLNGIVAIQSAVMAFDELKDDVIDPEKFVDATDYIINRIYNSNEALGNQHREKMHEPSERLGIAKIIMPDSLRRFSVFDALKKNMNEMMVEIPYSIDNCGQSILIETETYTSEISGFAQFCLLKELKEKSNMNIRCVDLVKGGSFFTIIHPIVSKFPEKTKGKIITKEIELDSLIKELEEVAAKAIARLGGKYTSVVQYNNNNTEKLPEFYVIFNLGGSVKNQDLLNRLSLLMNNSKINGISMVVIGENNILQMLKKDCDLYFLMKKNELYVGEKGRAPFEIDSEVFSIENIVEQVVDKMCSARVIDTNYSRHKSLFGEMYGMDATRKISIPFGFDANGILREFEIGGIAPPHALLSGSTGSGKSVALHTLILQTIYNYHPDDVEIWAIDYKAVEFNTYIRNRSPHFKVIAQDTSLEFSLSLLDTLYTEYERRQQEFIRCGVKNIEGYRKINGKYSMPRILVIIDEFQMMTQAVQLYSGNKDYRTVLENLLRLTRAMGISFILCSQTIASGLSGLTDSARDQIGCRLCLKHDDDNEIRETLVLSGTEASEIVERAKNLKKGQGIYKRVLDHPVNGRAYEFQDVNIFYIDDENRESIINNATETASGNFTEKEEIIVKGNGRISITEKRRHPLQKFISDHRVVETEGACIYPAAPTTLDDDYSLTLDNATGANVLMVGEADDLRESIVIHSVCSLLIDPEIRIVFSVIDENFSDRKRMLSYLKKIRSNRLIINVGIKDSLSAISELKKIGRGNRKTIYFWYGLEKIKNELFLMEQDESSEEIEESVSVNSSGSSSKQEMIDDLLGFLAEINGTAMSESIKDNKSNDEKISFEESCHILRQAFEMGPENDIYHFVIFNNNKAIKNMKKAGMIDLESFEHRIGTRMSIDDSYDLFNSSLVINKTDDNTVIYYSGSGQVVPLRPYLFESDRWFEEYNDALKSSEEE